MSTAVSPETDRGSPSAWRFFVYSAVGVFMFFLPITIGDTSTIPLDHLVTWVIGVLGSAAKYVALVLIVAGTLY
ncbi:MAG: YjiH family protein, partial [Actinomycetota bacterium]|nr:YjiH family protein [Actinomycetota bacterium]